MKKNQGNKLKWRNRLLPVLLAVLLLTGTTAMAYADEYMTFRGEDKISFQFPDDWTDVEESDELGEDYGDGQIEQILAASSDSGVDFDLYYMAEEQGEYLYLDSEEDLQSYYDTYGEEALTDFLENYLETEIIELKEPEYFESEWVNYLELEATVDEGETYHELIYLTAQCDMVHKIFRFSKEEDTDFSTLRTAAKPIMDSFYDYGYDRIMLGEDDSFFDGSDSFDFGESAFDVSDFLESVIPLAVVILVAVISYKKAKKNKAGGSHARRSMQERMRIPGAETRTKQKRSAGNARQEWHKKSTAGAGHAHMQGEGFRRKKSEISQFVPSKDSLESYVECLRTLEKAGVVTRKEFNELLEKHGLK